ncbi:hypothetical protein NEF87_000252 [Candidatus Lokiarchaeum ossiferum]|uniref:Uncharacterized protein n=1 Tax=Candidatus Lokiarchaeum ossiferum TaxID=2951803 RepID=A0ABY6HKB6_9ARCH|nr:hypothetical protein NEF87_000252 [Candidatus Lokiarchaeum sp. B-35]
MERHVDKSSIKNCFKQKTYAYDLIMQCFFLNKEHIGTEVIVNRTSISNIDG